MIKNKNQIKFYKIGRGRIFNEKMQYQAKSAKSARGSQKVQAAYII